MSTQSGRGSAPQDNHNMAVGALLLPTAVGSRDENWLLGILGRLLGIYGRARRIRCLGEGRKSKTREIDQRRHETREICCVSGPVRVHGSRVCPVRG